jgi:hypothetical protein
MADEGLDYAWARPDLDLAWSLGYRFVSRYLSWLPNGKVIDKAELSQLLAKGFHVALNWEFDAQDQLGGAVAGNQHATEAVKQAKALGYPAGCTIYFSADFDTSEAQQATVNAYMTAAGKVVHAAGYRIGIYGGYYVVKRAFDAGVTDDGWQTYAWSAGQWDDRAAIRQDQNGISVGGADCDHNTRVGQTYLMGQAAPTTVEDDMAETFVKNGDKWWISSGRFRQQLDQTQFDNINYWYNKRSGRTVNICVDDDGKNPKNFADVDMPIWGVDVATLQSGAAGPHSHPFSGTTGPAE